MPKVTARRTTIIPLIVAALKAHLAQPGEGQFLKKWFVDQGASYFFAFKKNLDVTNIQYGELVSLIVKYRTDAHEELGRLQFLTRREFNEIIANVIATHLPLHDPTAQSNIPEKRRLNAVAHEIAERYWDLLMAVVVIEPLFGSCAVFLPPGVNVDLGSICAAAGYVQSCGPILFLRNLMKAREEHLLQALNTYLTTNPIRAGKKRRFIVYSHEDFTAYDRSSAEELRHGLDDLKLYVHKFHMGDKSLIEVLGTIAERYASQLVIPKAGDFRLEHTAMALAEHDIDSDRTLWLLIDREHQRDLHSGVHKRYYVCYEQQSVNENVFHILDENKPAWIAHTTIPHTLIGAMLNLTWMYMPRENGKLVDPFVGSGTTLLEAIKFPDLYVKASDISVASDQLTRDNLEFMSLEADGLRRHIASLDTMREQIRGERRVLPPSLEAAYNEAYGRMEELSQRAIREVHQGDVTWLRESPMLVRILFYTGLKAAVRHRGAIDRKAENTREAFADELERLVLDLRRLLDIRLRQEAGVIELGEGFVVFRGKYSKACGIANKLLAKVVADKCGDGMRLVEECDASRGFGESKFDVIIADPPYGFNQLADKEHLSQLFRAMIPYFLNHLNDRGQLVLALPEASRTGRPFLFFTQPDMVKHHIMVEAHRLHMDVIATGVDGSRPDLARPPYYWESERALRRSILHFRFRTHERAVKP
jgi:tRNA G10  N-methylase Trm11